MYDNYFRNFDIFGKITDFLKNSEIYAQKSLFIAFFVHFFSKMVELLGPPWKLVDGYPPLVLNPPFEISGNNATILEYIYAFEKELCVKWKKFLGW